MIQTKYMREGKGTCKICARDLDLVLAHLDVGPRLVVSRHLRRIEEYTSKGAKPAGFCDGSLDEPETKPEPRHNHPTRDIKKPGQCPSCDLYHARRARK